MKLCDLNTSKALHALGYSGETTRWYNRDGELREWHLVDDEIAAPRLDDAAYWLRERHGLLIYITYIPDSRLYCPHIADVLGYYNSGYYCPDASTDYDTALENAVKKAIEIIKKKQQ